MYGPESFDNEDYGGYVEPPRPSRSKEEEAEEEAMWTKAYKELRASQPDAPKPKKTVL